MSYAHYITPGQVSLLVSFSSSDPEALLSAPRSGYGFGAVSVKTGWQCDYNIK